MDFSSKHFLFLQGPHGPFFKRFAEILSDAGAQVRKIGFNGGDEVFWSRDLPYHGYQGQLDDWADYIAQYIKENSITDLVLYGDTRSIHAQAIKAAKARNITVHCFEEGYLRPYWMTYERDGVNGYSALMDMSVADIRKKRQTRHVDLQQAPAQWGSLWHHNWYGFVYHFFLALRSRRYSNYRPHRNISIWREVELNAKRLLTWPYKAVMRDIKTKKFLNSGHPFYVVLLQLDHDSSLRYHSDYESQKTFIDEIILAFSKAAPPHIQLVFKMHPLEDGRVPLHRWINDAAKISGVENRIHVFSGGKLGNLISHARAALSINSTSVQQAMWRGIPVRLCGRSIFDKSEFTSSQNWHDFFKKPRLPDRSSFLEYRSYLLETSQIVGGFYTQSGRSEALRYTIDLAMAKIHPYDE